MIRIRKVLLADLNHYDEDFLEPCNCRILCLLPNQRIDYAVSSSENAKVQDTVRTFSTGSGWNSRMMFSIA